MAISVELAQLKEDIAAAQNEQAWVDEKLENLLMVKTQKGHDFACVLLEIKNLKISKKTSTLSPTPNKTLTPITSPLIRPVQTPSTLTPAQILPVAGPPGVMPVQTSPVVGPCSINTKCKLQPIALFLMRRNHNKFIGEPPTEYANV